MGEEGYAPWPAGVMDARLDRAWGDNQSDAKWAGLEALWFLSPETEGWHAGSRCVIHVSRTAPAEGTDIGGMNIWQITENGDGTITVSPSVHFIGHFHSPKPVSFRLVDELAD